MERVSGEATSAAAAGSTAGAVPQYQPPAVAWEEEFAPLAASPAGCDPGDGSGCVPFAPPWGESS